MHGLLAPAISFMNRLSYAKKFGVISLTFFIPLILLSYAIINQTYQSIQKTQAEYHSVTIIHDLLNVADEAALYRDISAAENFYEGTGLTDKANNLESQFMDSLMSLKEKNKGNMLSEEIDGILSYWKSSNATEKRNGRARIKDQFNIYNELVLKILFLTQKIAQQSGVSLDTDQTVQILLKLIISDYPSYLESMGFSHSVAIFSTVEKYISNAAYDSLNEAYDVLDKASKDIKQNHMGLLSGNKIFKESYRKLFSQVEIEIENVRLKIDEDIIAASNLEINWSEFSDFYQTKLPVFGKVRAITIDHLQNILQLRIDNLTKKLITVAVAIALVMLLIVYLYAAFFWSVRSTVGQFHSAARDIAQGNMKARVKVESQDEMGELTHEFNKMVEKIHTLLKAVHHTASQVGSAMEQVGSNAEQSNKAANEQLHQTEQVASAVTQMSASAEEVNRQSKEAADSASQATSQAGEANVVVDETLSQINLLADEIMRSTDVINQLSENSANIASMLAVIKGIAEQTNLLALNAAIEAARAGEQGRGFAVVADEVRTLASRTQSSAQEIEEVMTSLHTGIGSAVDVMGKSHMMAQDTVKSSAKVRTALEEIVSMVGNISNINEQISVSADEQTQVARAIDENVIKINDLGKATVGDAEHTVEAIKEVMALTESLQRELEKFEV